MEQHISRIENSLSSLEESVILQMGEIKISLERINNKMAMAAERLSLIESEISKLGKSVGKSATKTELRQIESFIDLVNPITSKFVTKDELERAVDDVARKKV